VLGGALVALAGWPAIFVANVPVALLGIVLAQVWLPPDPKRTPVVAADARQKSSTWQLLRSRALLGVYAQFAAVNVVFYAVFYGLPLWLEQTRNYGAGVTGLLILPVAGVGVLATPLAARMINRSGPRPALILGSVLLLVGSLLLLQFDSETTVLVLLLVGGVLGVPNGFNNLGLQAALYEAARPEQIGAAAGFLQTCRYVGAIVSTAIIGIVFGAEATSESLHVLAVIMAVVSAGLVLASLLEHRNAVSSD
jgi:predicted MFS family arabinose efflux permease